MKIINKKAGLTFFSICIPQHNRTSFLLESLKSVKIQNFTDFEVCISDDCSTDGREKEILDFLDSSGMSYVFEKQPQNRKYDANLRASMALASGRYCFLLGNDDALSSEETLSIFYEAIAKHNYPEVVISNFQDYKTSNVNRRVHGTGLLGSGPCIAVDNFRNFSFVSGVLLERKKAQEFSTDRWDGSEMYQMYIGSRMIASGGALLSLADSLVKKDIFIQGESVDNYARVKKIKPCRVVERLIPLTDFGRVAADAILPAEEKKKRQRLLRKIFLQFFLVTASYWLIEYRRVQSFQYSLGVYLGLRPKNSLKDIEMNPMTYLAIRSYYILSFFSLMVPITLFFLIKPGLYFLIKRKKRGDLNGSS